MPGATSEDAHRREGLVRKPLTTSQGCDNKRREVLQNALPRPITPLHYATLRFAPVRLRRVNSQRLEFAKEGARVNPQLAGGRRSIAMVPLQGVGD